MSVERYNAHSEQAEKLTKVLSGRVENLQQELNEIQNELDE